MGTCLEFRLKDMAFAKHSKCVAFNWITTNKADGLQHTASHTDTAR